MFSPREALSAISSALIRALDVFEIALLLLFGGLPGGHQVIVLAIRIAPDSEDHGTEAAPAPTDGYTSAVASPGRDRFGFTLP